MARLRKGPLRAVRASGRGVYSGMAMKSLFDRFRKGLSKTAQLFNIRSWFGRKVDQSFLDDLEARLIQADVGVGSTRKIIDRVREAYGDKTADEDLVGFVKGELKALLADPRPATLAVSAVQADGLPDRGRQRLGQDDLDRQARAAPEGRGQEDPAGGLRHLPRRGGRAADHLGRPRRVRHRQGGARRRPGQRGARRLRPRHGPPGRRPDRRHRRPPAHPDAPDARAREDPRRPPAEDPGAPHEVLLVLDATNGQNAIRQAEAFTKSIGCTGIILTKLDGTAKGGVVFAIRQAMNLPVKFIGVGEGLDDLEPFDPDTFVESLFA